MSKKPKRNNRKSPNNGRRSSNRNRRRNASPMTAEEIGVIKSWLDRMQVSVKRGMGFAAQVSDKGDFHEDSPIYWATVKAIENATESVKQLDDINGNILRELFEIDEWQQIKGMRDVVAHQFWRLDADVIWNTARSDLPELHKLLGNLNVKDEPHDDLSRIPHRFTVNETYSPSQRAESSQPVKPGEFIILAWFDSNRKLHTRRIKEQYEYCASCGEKSYRIVMIDRKLQQTGRPLSPPICNRCRGLEQRAILLECEDCGTKATIDTVLMPGQTPENSGLCPECPGQMRIVVEGTR